MDESRAVFDTRWGSGCRVTKAVWGRMRPLRSGGSIFIWDAVFPLPYVFNHSPGRHTYKNLAFGRGAGGGICLYARGVEGCVADGAFSSLCASHRLLWSRYS